MKLNLSIENTKFYDAVTEVDEETAENFINEGMAVERYGELYLTDRGEAWYERWLVFGPI